MGSSVTSTATIQPLVAKNQAHADADPPAAAGVGSGAMMKQARDTRRGVDGVMGLDEKENVTEKATGLEKEGDPSDRFFWTYTEEPHRTRRQAIIKAHPEVCLVFLSVSQLNCCNGAVYSMRSTHQPPSKTSANPAMQVLKLCGPEPLTKYVVLGVVCLQVVAAYLLRNTPILSWPFLATAYIIGATANQNLFLAIHEISHNLAFKSPLANRLCAVFANLPIGLPYSAAFRVRHPPYPPSRDPASILWSSEDQSLTGSDETAIPLDAP